MKGIMLKDLYENFCIPKHLAAYIFGYCHTALLKKIFHKTVTRLKLCTICLVFIPFCLALYHNRI